MAGDSEGRTPGGDQRPVPDPTSLTTEQLDKGLKALRELIEEKFKGVDQRFVLGEQQRVEQKQDTREAIYDALTAQKEAVKKAEDATAKQLDLILLGTADLKTRVERIENIKTGGQQAYTGIYMLAGFIVLILVIVGSIAGFGVGR